MSFSNHTVEKKYLTQSLFNTIMHYGILGQKAKVPCLSLHRFSSLLPACSLLTQLLPGVAVCGVLLWGRDFVFVFHLNKLVLELSGYTQANK